MLSICTDDNNKNIMKRLDLGHLYFLLEHPETNMSRPEIEPGWPASQASTLAKSYSKSFCCCYSEPLYSINDIVCFFGSNFVRN
jgi:hypothetical protein